MKTRKFCPHCGRPLVKSRTPGYAFQCHCCEEDFYRFEVHTTRRIDLVRSTRRLAYRWEVKNGYIPHSFKKPYPGPKPTKHKKTNNHGKRNLRGAARHHHRPQAQ